jgi:O-antigen/teichoic acid export membrane protein
MRDSLLTSAGSLTTIGLSGLASIVIARQLGPVGRGQWATIFSLATLVATLAGLGLPTASGYAAGKLDLDRRRQLITAALCASCALALSAAGAYLVVALAAGSAHASRAAIAVGAVIAALAVVQNVTQQLVLVASALRWFVLANVLPAGAALVAIGAFAVAGELTLVGVVVIYAARIAACGLIALVGLADARRHAGVPRESPRQAARRVLTSARSALVTLSPYWSYALMTFATLSLTQVVQRVDVLLVAGLRGSRDAGFYAVAVQLLELLVVVPGALGFLLFRRGARSTHGHWEDTLTALRWTFAIQLVCAGVLFVFAPKVVTVVYGLRYRHSVVAVRWLMPGAVMLGAQTVVSNYIASRGRPRSVLVAWAVGAVLGVGLNLLVIPTYGIAGAAAVSSLAYTVILGLHLVALQEVRRADAPHLDRGRIT